MAIKYIVLQLVIFALVYKVVESTFDKDIKVVINGVTENINVSTVADNTTDVTTEVPSTTQSPPTTPTIPTTTATPTQTTTKATTAPPTTTITTHPTTPVAPITTPTSPTTTLPTTPAAPTTEIPVTTTEVPHHGRRFDGPSFIGGIILAAGLMAIGFVSWKFYKARTELNYHTL